MNFQTMLVLNPFSLPAIHAQQLYFEQISAATKFQQHMAEAATALFVAAVPVFPEQPLSK